jgi:hypothetical protein
MIKVRRSTCRLGIFIFYKRERGTLKVQEGRKDGVSNTKSGRKLTKEKKAETGGNLKKRNKKKAKNKQK